MSQRPTLLIVDGHSMAFRAFFALPVENFTTRTGQHTNAVHGFVSMLTRLIKDEDPSHIAVAFDLPGGTFRTEQYQDYKGGRAATPPEFPGQVELIKEVLDALNITHLSVPGYEADDILATLATSASAADMDALVVSGDRDAMQLVTDQVTVLYPKQGVSKLERMTPQAVEEKYLVSPERYPELAALVGEHADNLPGVPGVGPKTAAKWLAAYDGLDNLLADADSVKGKAGASFRDHLDDVRRNRRLNALVRDLELEVGLDDLARRSWDQQATRQLFDSLEFRSLWDRVKAMEDTDEAQNSARTVEVTVQVPGEGELDSWLQAHRDVRLGVDATGTWVCGAGDVTGVVIGSPQQEAVRLDLTDLCPADEKAFADWLADPHCPKVMHAAKSQIEAFAARGMAVDGLSCDTELAAYLLHPDRRKYQLDDLVLEYLDLELVPTHDQPSQGTLDFGDDDATAELSARRAVLIARLADVLERELDNRSELGLLHDLELLVQRSLVAMEQAGVAVDTDVLDGLRADFDSRVRKAEELAWQAAGEQVNLGSPKQLQAVLFDRLDMPKTRRTKSGYTTDAAALEGLFKKTQHPFLAHLLAHREAIRMRQTIDGLLKSIADDGRIHTTYQQTVAATGRLSSTDPNLQNIPMRTEEGRRIREGFVVGEGYASLMSADYSQIEMRIMAHACGDESLIEAFASGLDFHTVTASHVFRVPIENVTAAQRSKVKAMNYGLAYGLSDYGLSQRLDVPVTEARELMDDYFSRFGKVQQYLNQVVDQARRDGWTSTLLGRRRYLPDLNSSNRQRREMAERAALNAPIQGTAADLMKLAMLATDQGLAEHGLRSRVLLQIHDELVLEVAPREEQRVREVVTDAMGGAMDLAVPLTVAIGVGRSWFDAAH